MECTISAILVLGLFHIVFPIERVRLFRHSPYAFTHPGPLWVCSFCSLTMGLKANMVKNPFRLQQVPDLTLDGKGQVVLTEVSPSSRASSSKTGDASGRHGHVAAPSWNGKTSSLPWRFTHRTSIVKEQTPSRTLFRCKRARPTQGHALSIWHCLLSS